MSAGSRPLARSTSSTSSAARVARITSPAVVPRSRRKASSSPPDAVEGDTARRRAGDRPDHLGAALREAFEVGPVVERGPELRAAFPDVPELAFLADVEGDVKRLDRGRPRRRVGADFALVPQVDDGADPVILECGPTRRRQGCQRVGVPPPRQYHRASCSSALRSATGPRCASLSGLTIELMPVIWPPETSSPTTPSSRCCSSR